MTPPQTPKPGQVIEWQGKPHTLITAWQTERGVWWAQPQGTTRVVRVRVGDEVTSGAS